MSQQWGKLSNLFSADIKLVLNKILENDLTLTLIGGGFRDLYCKKIVCNDLDFEIRTNDKIELDHFLNKLEEAFKKIEQETSFEVEKLPLGGYRCFVGNNRLEFTPPRLEKYDKNKEVAFGHSDFSLEIISNLDYSISFSRRDFTINAIGLELALTTNEVKENIIDPFDGISDLKSLKLKNITSSFFYDPVRFLRLVRFKLEMGFEIDESILLNLNLFNLSKMTTYYYFKEAFKVGFHQFSHLFFELVLKYNILFPEEYIVLKRNFKNLQAINSDLIKDKEAAMLSLALDRQGEIKKKEMAYYLKVFSAKKHWASILNQVIEVISLLEKWNLKEINRAYTQENFNDVKEMSFFRSIVLYYRIAEKIERYNSLIEGQINDKELEKYNYLKAIAKFQKEENTSFRLEINKNDILDEDKNDFIIYNKFLLFEKKNDH